MREWTFGRRLVGGIFVIASFTAVIGAVSYVSVGEVVDSNDRVIRVTAQSVVDAEVLRGLAWERVALVRAYLLTGREADARAVRTVDARFARVVANLRARALTEGEGLEIDRVERARAAHQREVELLLTARRRGTAWLGAGGLSEAFDAEVLPRFEALDASLSDFAAGRRRIAEAQRQQASRDAEGARHLLLGLSLGVLLLAAAIAFALTRGLARQVGAAVQSVRASSAELEATATEQATSSKQQATVILEVTSTLDELLASARQIADLTRRVAEVAGQAREASRGGDAAVDTTRLAVDAIRGQVDSIVEHMLELERRSRQAGGILELINELSEQTNILAINATIEAAGAGEHGRRFAAVGEEIRKLADRVAGSTREIRELIDQMRASVSATVMATESGSKAVAEGTIRFAELQETFARVGDLIDETASSGRDIELATQQQSSAVEQLSSAMRHASQATRESEAAATETQQTATELLGLSKALARIVEPARRRGGA